MSVVFYVTVRRESVGFLGFDVFTVFCVTVFFGCVILRFFILRQEAAVVEVGYTGRINTDTEAVLIFAGCESSPVFVSINVGVEFIFVGGIFCIVRINTPEFGFFNVYGTGAEILGVIKIPELIIVFELRLSCVPGILFRNVVVNEVVKGLDCVKSGELLVGCCCGVA